MQLLDALFVSVGLDPTAFKQGHKEVQEAMDKTGKAADKTQKDIDDAAKKTAEAYKRVRDGILEITAAIVGAVAGKEFLAYITANDAAVGRLSKNLGIATDELSIWEGVFSRMGSSSADADSMLRGINKILADIRNTGGSDALYPLARAGLDIAKFNDGATTMTDRVKMISEALKKLTPQDAQYWAQKFGFSEDTVSVLIQTRRSLGDLIEEQKHMNAVSAQDAAAAMEREKAWNDLTQTLSGFGRKVATELTPAIAGLLNGMQSLVRFLENHMPYANALLGGMVSVMTVLTAYKLSTWAAGWSGAMGVIGTAASTLIGRLGMLGLALASLYEIYNLAKAVYDLIDAKTRTGVTPTSESQARINAGALAGGSSGTPRGIRNNNPGNLEFRGQAGASREGGAGRFAVFGSMAEGIAALEDQLRRYAAGGADSIRAVVSRYAPPGENNTDGYIAAMSRALGVSPDAHLNFNDMATARAFISSLTTQEGNRVDMDQINAGLDLAQRRSAGGGGSTVVTTGDIHVHTHATDAKGIAKDIGRELRNFAFASQANTGLN